MVVVWELLLQCRLALLGMFVPKISVFVLSKASSRRIQRECLFSMCCARRSIDCHPAISVLLYTAVGRSTAVGTLDQLIIMSSHMIVKTFNKIRALPSQSFASADCPSSTSSGLHLLSKPKRDTNFISGRRGSGRSEIQHVLGDRGEIHPSPLSPRRQNCEK